MYNTFRDFPQNLVPTALVADSAIRLLPSIAVIQTAQAAIEAAGPPLVKPSPTAEAVKAEVVIEPWEFKDANGTFVVQWEYNAVYSFNWNAWKRYTSGAMAGQTVAITKEEYHAFVKEGQDRWGYIKQNLFGAPSQAAT
jgi:hypothetical protein